jgi:hypothetical protein
MLEQRNFGATAMTAPRFAFSLAAAAPEHRNESIVADAALMAELALTFDLDTLVAEALIDPFRR